MKECELNKFNKTSILRCYVSLRYFRENKEWKVSKNPLQEIRWITPEKIFFLKFATLKHLYLHDSFLQLLTSIRPSKIFHFCSLWCQFYTPFLTLILILSKVAIMCQNYTSCECLGPQARASNLNFNYFPLIMLCQKSTMLGINFKTEYECCER